MKSLSYTKIDFMILLKSSLKYMLLIFGIAIWLIICGNTLFGLNYLYFMIVIFSSIPFTNCDASRCEQFYSTFPGKINEMIRGRYLYMFLLWIAEAVFVNVVGFVMFNIGKISMTDFKLLILSAFLGIIIVCFQYPLYYKFGFQKGSIVSSMIYILPAILLVLLPLDLLKGDTLSLISTIADNTLMATVFLILVSVLCLYVSYVISCAVYKKKEL